MKEAEYNYDLLVALSDDRNASTSALTFQVDFPIDLMTKAAALHVSNGANA